MIYIHNREGRRMSRKAVSGIMVILLLMGMLTLAFNIQPAKASGTIYIKADGSVEPDTAPISTVDNITYVLTGDIYESIVVERDNIVINGEGYIVQGTGSGTGIYLSRRSNVTIKNSEIRSFEDGIRLSISSNNSIFGNSIANNDGGVLLRSSSNYNSIVENNITKNGNGITLDDSSNHNHIFGNKITANNGSGIHLSGRSYYNSISANVVANNEYGVYLSGTSSNNTISGNNITDN
jgi:parallel beta-helix repeat protein